MLFWAKLRPKFFGKIRPQSLLPKRSFIESVPGCRVAPAPVLQDAPLDARADQRDRLVQQEQGGHLVRSGVDEDLEPIS
jgi:hypothetical protein